MEKTCDNLKQNAPNSQVTERELTAEIWGFPNVALRPNLYVYEKRENAEHVRSRLAEQWPSRDWHQLILHKNDPLPKGLCPPKYFSHPDEDKVEFHRLAFEK